MLSYSDEIFADAGELTDHSDYCRREQRMVGELKISLSRALSMAPSELYRDTQRLISSADDLETYFGEMQKALLASSDTVEDFARYSASRMQDADDELSRLLRT